MKFVGLLRLAVACELATACNSPSPETGKIADLRDRAPETQTPSTGEGHSATAEYRFSDFDNLPKEFSVLFKPDGGSPQHYVAYIKDIDRAYFELKRGNAAKAAESFAVIGKETLFEMPNDATWAGHAESLCRSGQNAEGRKQLAEAQCSHQLLSNRVNCSGLDRRVSEPDFPAACYREYCEAEILRPDFDRPDSTRPTPGDEQRLSGYADYLDTVARSCR